MILREAPLLAAIGVVIGLPAAWVATHAISSMLYGLKVTDRLTILASTLLGRCVVSCYGCNRAELHAP